MPHDDPGQATRHVRPMSEFRKTVRETKLTQVPKRHLTCMYHGVSDGT